MAYLTKNKDGLIQLWNNKPELSKNKDIWTAWIDKKNINNILNFSKYESEGSDTRTPET